MTFTATDASGNPIANPPGRLSPATGTLWHDHPHVCPAAARRPLHADRQGQRGRSGGQQARRREQRRGAQRRARTSPAATASRAATSSPASPSTAGRRSAPGAAAASTSTPTETSPSTRRTPTPSTATSPTPWASPATRSSPATSDPYAYVCAWQPPTASQNWRPTGWIPAASIAGLFTDDTGQVVKTLLESSCAASTAVILTPSGCRQL